MIKKEEKDENEEDREKGGCVCVVCGLPAVFPLTMGTRDS